MINRQALIVVLAAFTTIQNVNAFVPSSTMRSTPPSALFSSTEATEATQKVEEQTMQAAETTPEAEKLIMDIPPTPVAAKKAAPKKKGGVHKEGVFSPIVVAAGAVMGEQTLKKVRAKIISYHSDVIKSFVGTSDSEFGKAVLKQIFNLVDTDNSGYLDKDEVAVALNMLGFKWLGEKQVAKIFERADANGDMEISLEEFMQEAPKTLKTNLIKLAKNNGGDMGLLV